MYEPGNGTDPRSVVEYQYTVRNFDPDRVVETIKAGCMEKEGWHYAIDLPFNRAGGPAQFGAFSASRYPERVSVTWIQADRAGKQTFMVVHRREATFLERTLDRVGLQRHPSHAQNRSPSGS